MRQSTENIVRSCLELGKLWDIHLILREQPAGTISRSLADDVIAKMCETGQFEETIEFSKRMRGIPLSRSESDALMLASLSYVGEMIPSSYEEWPKRHSQELDLSPETFQALIVALIDAGHFVEAEEVASVRSSRGFDEAETDRIVTALIEQSPKDAAEYRSGGIRKADVDILIHRFLRGETKNENVRHRISDLLKTVGASVEAIDAYTLWHLDTKKDPELAAVCAHHGASRAVVDRVILALCQDYCLLYLTYAEGLSREMRGTELSDEETSVLTASMRAKHQAA